ncbi:putative thymidylate synthase [Xanthomonas phage Xp15]|uniref:Putative thymidylate synthase n=1 Tax=Xanthomonas phage Xp15 TaxID=322855 RepID=Q52PP0_9CAUD|nr:putative thymidylate synthase [Xanthomonas phage Xp15]AAX84875.1 putative thymidylate synthase [Xanthomonas phage Xp15]
MSYHNATLSALRDLMLRTFTQGFVSKPRGMEIRELLNAQVTVQTFVPFQCWPDRKYDIGYFKKEMRWKLGASKFDDSIKQHAKMWESVQNPDGTFNSNYGQFWFGQQMGVMKVVMELIRDQDSRRAIIPMLTDDHLSPETVDTVCTEAVSFHIRHNTLYTSVHMRSSDQIFGLGTDIPTFSVLTHLVHGLLQANYPSLQVGSMTITAASSHIYERHYRMVDKILDNLEDIPDSEIVILPQCSGPDEAMAIIAHRGIAQRLPASWHLYRFIYGD